MSVPAKHQIKHPDLLVAVFLLLLTVFRFWYAGSHDLLEDESYYWQWSRHLAWGYYDNTPLVAPVIHLGVLLFGSNPIGVRVGAIVCSLVAAIFIYLLTKRLLGVPVALLAVVLANSIPFFAAGAIIMTQDPVHVALWAATLYFVYRALTDRPYWSWWIGAGLLAGLTVQAKLNGLLLLPGVFLYLVLSPTARLTWLRRPQPYVAGLITLLVFSPFVWWNHTHQDAFWIHIGAMGSRNNPHDPPLSYFGNFMGAQALLISPFVFLTYLYTLYDGWRCGVKEHDEARLFLWSMSVVVFVVTIIVSLHSKVEGNWAIAAYITGMILTADVLWRLWQRRGPVLPVLCVAIAVFISVGTLFPAILYGMGFKFADPTLDRTDELHGWHRMAADIEANRAAMGGDPFVFGVNYRMPSEAAFYLPGQPQTYSFFLHDRANEYMFWEDPAQMIGRNAVFVNDSNGPDHFRALSMVFQHIAPQPPLKIYRNPPYRTPIRIIQIVRCYGFKGYHRRHWQQGW